MYLAPCLGPALAVSGQRTGQRATAPGGMTPGHRPKHRKSQNWRMSRRRFWPAKQVRLLLPRTTPATKCRGCQRRSALQLQPRMLFASWYIFCYGVLSANTAIWMQDNLPGTVSYETAQNPSVQSSLCEECSSACLGSGSPSWPCIGGKMNVAEMPAMAPSPR